jgi:hypothetical protein
VTTPQWRTASVTLSANTFQPFNAFFQQIPAGKTWKIYALRMVVQGDTAAFSSGISPIVGVYANPPGYPLPSLGSSSTSEIPDVQNRVIRIDDPSKAITGGTEPGGTQQTTTFQMGITPTEIPSLWQVFGTYTQEGAVPPEGILLRVDILYYEQDACPCEG